jgi:large subunit ribosomal protein L32
MAVQKSKVSRARRGHRRSHDKLTAASLAVDPHTGELHRSHHITPKGFYKGRQIIKDSAVDVDDTEE